jgi:hypothetical protein
VENKQQTLPSRQQVIEEVLGDVIRELKEVPSGHLYAHVMGRISWHEYNATLASLKRQGKIKEKYHVLTWTGVAKPQA